MNERDKLIEKLIREKGGTREQYLQLLNGVAFHESNKTFDPTIKQKGGGPGRGKYQFEIGKNKGGATAAKRTRNYYEESGDSVPKWLKNAANKKDVDVSELSGDQQDILFLGNMRKHPKANFSNLWEGKQDIPEFWANYHWAGPSKQRNKRVRQFTGDLKEYNTKQQEIKDIKANPVQPRPEVVKDAVNIKQPQIRKFAHGGGMDLMSYIKDKNLNEFNSGGSHEQNANGGIPQGMGNNGKPNTVEEGETSYNLPEGKFIFTDRIFTTGKRKTPSTDGYADGGLTPDPTDPPKKEQVVAKSRDFVNNWFGSNVTKSRLAQNLNKAPYDLIKPVKAGIQNVQDAKINYKGESPSADAEYKNGEITFYGEPTPATSTHEFTHAMGVDNDLTKYIRNNYGTPAKAIQEKTGLPFKEAVAQEHNIDTSGFMGRSKLDQTIKHSRYLSEDGELYPRIMEMRRELNVKPGDIIEDAHIDQLKEGNNPMFKYYKPEQIKDMLNKLARVHKDKNHRTKSELGFKTPSPKRYT